MTREATSLKLLQLKKGLSKSEILLFLPQTQSVKASISRARYSTSFDNVAKVNEDLPLSCLDSFWINMDLLEQGKPELTR